MYVAQQRRKTKLLRHCCGADEGSQQKQKRSKTKSRGAQESNEPCVSGNEFVAWAKEFAVRCAAQRQILKASRVVDNQLEEQLIGADDDHDGRDEEMDVEWTPRCDDALRQMCRFTDPLPLSAYSHNLTRVPRLVNVVTLVDVEAVAGSGTRMPLDLAHIARSCNGAYFAPAKFAAVQLALSNPRCRVLVFHTGRLVGTGTTSHTSARLAIMLVRRRLATQANVHLRIKSYDVINTVGAVCLNASFSCESFARDHTSTSMLDRSSFVGLVWRPKRCPVRLEVYSTGNCNLPGSRTNWALLHYFSRLLPEILKYSSEKKASDDQSRAIVEVPLSAVDPAPSSAPDSVDSNAGDAIWDALGFA